MNLPSDAAAVSDENDHSTATAATAEGADEARLGDHDSRTESYAVSEPAAAVAQADGSDSVQHTTDDASAVSQQDAPAAFVEYQSQTAGDSDAASHDSIHSIGSSPRGDRHGALPPQLVQRLLRFGASLSSVYGAITAHPPAVVAAPLVSADQSLVSQSDAPDSNDSAVVEDVARGAETAETPGSVAAAEPSMQSEKSADAASVRSDDEAMAELATTTTSQIVDAVEDLPPSPVLAPRCVPSQQAGTADDGDVPADAPHSPYRVRSVNTTTTSAVVASQSFGNLLRVSFLVCLFALSCRTRRAVFVQLTAITAIAIAIAAWTAIHHGHLADGTIASVPHSAAAPCRFAVATC